jgi:hypothetical protein
MLIPDNINEFSSNGERILYLKFKNDRSTNSMFILHSLFTNYHIKNMSGELDFLILAPGQGFFSIEVKHGGISRKNGDWCYTNRDGKTTCKPTGPFAQQNATINSIRHYVLGKLENNKELYNRFSKILWGSGVAFTSMTEFFDFGPEGHSWQVLTRQGLDMPIGSFISSLSKGFHKECEGKHWYDVHKSKPTKSDCELLLKILRGDFEIDYSEINRINETEEAIEEYTKEQFSLLEFARYNNRCLIQGSAGTGKTIMAIELLKRQTDACKKVGMFCFNNQLGEKISSISKNISNSKNTYAGTIHSYMAQKTNCQLPINADEVAKYYSEDLPIEFLISNENLDDNQKIDFLIVDEAQDLISPYYLEVFDVILKGGLRNGNWVLFGDFSNQAIYLNNPEDSLKLLSNRATYTSFPPLRINCRNTREIATQNTLLTGAELPEFTSKNYSGNYVVCKYPTKATRIKVLHEILQKIIDRDIPPNKVTLLSSKRFENSFVSEDAYINELAKKGLKTSTIQAYKGLENVIVIIIDLDEVSSDQIQRLLYVGISRAKLELYLILDKGLETAVGKLVQENVSKLQ